MKFKSAWITGINRLETIDEELLSPAPDEVIVKVKSCGICGTDLHFLRDYPGNGPTPVGHEVAGTVEETGSLVTHLRTGDEVVVQNHIPCGICRPCLNRDHGACTGIRTYMDDRAAMAEYLRVPAAMAVRFDGLDFGAATLAEPLTVSLDLLREADISPGDDVLVIGPGIIGLGAVKLAKLRGARSVVLAGRRFESARGAARKAAGARLGASRCIDTAVDGWKDSLREAFPDGFQKVIVTAPPAAIPDGIELAAFGGDIIYDGISFSDDSLTISANELHFSKKHLKPSHAIPNWGFPIAIDLLKNGDVAAELLMTHRFPFEELEQAFETAASASLPVIKVVVDF